MMAWEAQEGVTWVFRVVLGMRELVAVPRTMDCGLLKRVAQAESDLGKRLWTTRSHVLQKRFLSTARFHISCIRLLLSSQSLLS